MGLKKLKKLLESSRLAIDSNIFIYALTRHPEFPTAVSLLDNIADYRGQAFTSILTITEITVPIFRDRQQYKIQKYVEFVGGKGRIIIAPVDHAIALKAAEYRAKFRFKTPDAIQLATAVTNNANVFITADNDFSAKKLRSRSVDGVRIEVI